MNAKGRNGIYRRDYHRPNRKENKSTFSRSSGINVQPTSIHDPVFFIPKIPREKLIAEARRHYDSQRSAALHGYEETNARLQRKCVNYLRHVHTNYDYLRIRAYGAMYLRLARAFYDAVIAVYPWLESECEYQYSVKEQNREHKTIKVIKRSLTSLHVEDFNAAQEVKPEDPLTEEEEVPLFFNLLNSLDQSRFLYLPPFLKPHQVRDRRFGENANDRWWEWEEGLGLETFDGRPNPRNAQQ